MLSGCEVAERVKCNALRFFGHVEIIYIQFTGNHLVWTMRVVQQQHLEGEQEMP